MNLYIYGAGGNGRELFHIIKKNMHSTERFQNIFYIDRKLYGKEVYERSVYLLEEVAARKEKEDLKVIISPSDPITRLKMYDSLQQYDLIPRLEWVLCLNTELVTLSTYTLAAKWKDCIAYKDMDYIKWRYYEAPFYQYTIWGIEVEKKVNSIPVGREISYMGAVMLTLVDFIGDEKELGKIGTAVQTLMDAHSYEYVEFMCYGLEHSVLEKAGFTRREDNDENILPSHFEPFLCENIDKYLFTTKP